MHFGGTLCARTLICFLFLGSLVTPLNGMAVALLFYCYLCRNACVKVPIYVVNLVQASFQLVM